MAEVSIEVLKELRDRTGAGMMDCKSALEETGGDLDRAVALLRERGIAKAATRSGRETANGVVEAYLHRTGEDYPPQVGALVELDCESDFVAKGEEFRTLAREIALHVAAANPRWITRDEVPAEVIEQEREVALEQARNEGRPEAAWDKIVEGRLNGFFKDVTLLEQQYVRDNKRTVAQLLGDARVTRFARVEIGA